MRKRLLCLLLLLPMVFVSTLASSISPAGGKVFTSNSSGAGNDVAIGYHTGLALGIQVMDSDQYKVEPLTDAEKTDRADRAIDTEGLAHVCEHFLYSYPNPHNEDVFYLLPNTTYEPDWRATTVGGLGQTPILGRYARQEYLHSGYVDGRTLANSIYDKMVKGEADATYFKGLLDQVSYNTALSYIGYIFSPTVKNGDNWAPKVDEINKRWQQEYGLGTDGLNSTEQSKRKLANYTTILTCLAKLMSASKAEIVNSNNSKSVTGHTDYKGNAIEVNEVWDASNKAYYSTQIAKFAMRALNGEAYQPIVITAEVCMVFRHENSKLHYNTWRTSTEHMALLANVAESQIRNADSGVLKVKSLGDGDVNVAQTILKTAIKKGGGGGGTYGGYGFLGLGADGSYTKKYGVYGNVMTSLNSTAINCLQNDWNISVPGNGKTEALWGCGIFGGTEALTVVSDTEEEWSAQISGTVALDSTVTKDGNI